MQLGEGFGEAGERDGDADAVFFGLENDEHGGFAGFQFFDEGVLHDDLGVAGEVLAAQERGVADILLVDFQAKAGREQDADGSEHAQNAGTVGKFLEVDGEADVIAVLGGDTLNERANLALGARGGVLAHHLPIAVLGLYRAFLGGKGGERGDEREREQGQDGACRGRECHLFHLEGAGARAQESGADGILISLGLVSANNRAELGLALSLSEVSAEGGGYF